jgi:hypothetical protein
MPAYRDRLHRLLGVALLAGAGASTWVHRAVWQAHAEGPATWLEGALAALTLLLGSLGLLLIAGGCRLSDDWQSDGERAARRRRQAAAPPLAAGDDEAEHHRITQDALHASALSGARVPLAAWLVMRARHAALRGGAKRKARFRPFRGR